MQDLGELVQISRREVIQMEKWRFSSAIISILLIDHWRSDFIEID
jgi:hypothetical protein